MMENAAFLTEPASEKITPEKLREIANDWSHRSGELRNVIYTAADRIETLEATNAKLLAALEWLCVDAKITGLDQQAGWDCAFIAARAAIAAAKGEST